MQASPHDDPVYLGFAAEYETNELYRLKSCFLPLGKVGGKPSWLDPVNIPRSDDLKCLSCEKPMCFLLQVYATSEKDAPHSFHRTLFLFLCRNAQCSKANDSSNIRAFRCCIPRDNQWYPSTGPLDPDLVEEHELPPAPSIPHLCKICGCRADKKCAKCMDAWYCSRDHQALDWGTEGHRAKCGQPPSVEEEGKKNPENNFLFEEMGMEMDREVCPSKLFEEESDSEDDEEEEKDVEKRMNEYKKLMKDKKIEETCPAVDDEDVAEEKDSKFDRFNKLIQLNSEQILRYQRGGNALIPTDRAPPLNEALRCENCGAARSFELQLTPHLLSLLGVDSIGESIDWAAVYIFTCSANCASSDPSSSYLKELCLKHDFE